MNSPNTPVLNISAYKFVAIDDAETLRAEVFGQASAHELKGTVLIAEEGINLFLAGARDEVHGFTAWLRRDARFEDLQPKESWSSDAPFRKLLVKVKREIIRMNCPTVKPQAGRAPSVSADTLARWLEKGSDDDGRELIMLDTRNAFEVDIGRFENAVDWKLEKFSDFPNALADHRDELENKTIVSYCTGGIRCEKAALLMADLGVGNVLQLDGGILRYLELQSGKAGGRFYQGECFVFDERRSVDGELRAPDAAPGVREQRLPNAERETT